MMTQLKQCGFTAIILAVVGRFNHLVKTAGRREIGMQVIELFESTITAQTGYYPGKVKEVKKADFIFTPHKALKDFISCIGHKLITKGSEYYSVFLAGSGLGGMKLRCRIPICEIDQYCQKYNWSIK